MSETTKTAKRPAKKQKLLLGRYVTRQCPNCGLTVITTGNAWESHEQRCQAVARYLERQK